VNAFCKVQRSLAAILTAAVCPATLAVGQHIVAKSRVAVSEREKVTIASLEDKWLCALNTANVNGIAEVLADDFVRPAADYGRFVTKPDLLSYYRSRLSPQSPNKRRIEDLTVTLYGATALARGVVTSIDSKGHLISKLLFTDVFVRRNGRWQAVSAQENAVASDASATPAGVRSSDKRVNGS